MRLQFAFDHSVAAVLHAVTGVPRGPRVLHLWFRCIPLPSVSVTCMGALLPLARPTLVAGPLPLSAPPFITLQHCADFYLPLACAG